MKVIIGTDHRGYKLKEALKKYLKLVGYEVEDVGAEVYEAGDDYTDYAEKVVRKVVEGGKGVKGILLCGSGHGVDIVANRFLGIRSVLGFNVEVVVQGREHEDANVLSLPAEWVRDDEAKEMAEVFLKTEFSGIERYKRRLEKLEKLGKIE